MFRKLMRLLALPAILALLLLTAGLWWRLLTWPRTSWQIGRAHV